MLIVLLKFVNMCLEAYMLVIVATAIMSWLILFDVVNMRNQFVNMIWTFLYNITEPALRPIRRFVPNLGGIDISPIVLILGIVLVQMLITDWLLRVL
jgi:YggT family protein